MLANILVVLVVILLFVIAFILVRTILYGQPIEAVEPVALAEVDQEIVAEHLSAAIRHATVSYDDRARIDYTPFQELRRELEKLYPRAHTALKVETVNRHSLLYRQKRGRGAYRGARWDKPVDVRRWARQLKPAPQVTVRSAIFMPEGGAFARAAEAVFPSVLPWGAFLAVVLRKPEHSELISENKLRHRNGE